MFHSLLVTGRDAEDLLSRCAGDLAAVKGRYNLGVLYLTDHLAADAGGMVEAVRLATGVDHWVGGIGVGVLGSDGEAFDEPALSLLLADIPADGFRLFGPLDGSGPDAGLRRWMRDASPHLGLVHLDPRRREVPASMAVLNREGATYLVGGLLSSRSGYVQFAERTGEGVASGVLFAGNVPVAARLSQGCSPIGPRRNVTRVDGPLLLELDGRPALDALVADLGSDGGGATDVHVALPRRGSDTGDYRVRNLMGVDTEQGALAVGEQLAPGDSLMFCRRNADAARKDLERMLAGLARSVKAKVRGGVYVSCLARGPNLFAEPALEVELIRQHLGDIPLAGFYANGEVAGEEIYGYTGVLTLFT